MGQRTVRTFVVGGATGLLAALAACTPADPPVALTVTTEVDGGDAAPGDGACEMTPGLGDCSLRAAVDEGNALGAAAITLPAGTYRSRSVVVTGDLSVNWGAPVDAEIDVWITVAESGSLRADGLWSYGVPGARIAVDGAFVGRHLSLVGLESSGQIVVRSTGTAVVENSLLAHVFGNTASVQNQGTVVLRHTALLSWSQVGVPTTALSSTGTATVASSVLQRCAGTPPISVGYNSDDDGSCGLTAPGDQPGAPPVFRIDLQGPVTYDLAGTSPLVDAVPIGTNGCGTDVVDDVSGAPRPVDGDGDGVTGCDIGARELAGAP